MKQLTDYAWVNSFTLLAAYFITIWGVIRIVTTLIKERSVGKTAVEDLKKEMRERDNSWKAIIDRLEKDYIYMMEHLLKK